MKMNMESMICSKCSYDWAPRIKNPKSCPRCKVRFDYNDWKKVGG